MNRRIRLPPAVARIYEAVAELSAAYPGRSFTPDGHLVGSIGEVVAAEALGLVLYRQSAPGHDGVDANGREVQVKMTAGKVVAMSATCTRLVVLKVVSPTEAEIVFDDDGAAAWTAAGKPGKNGLRTISLRKLRGIADGTAGAEIAKAA